MMSEFVKLEAEVKDEEAAVFEPVSVIEGPQNFLRIHRNLHTGLWRARCMNGFSKPAMQIPTKFTPVRDIHSYFKRHGEQQTNQISDPKRETRFSRFCFGFFVWFCFFFS